MSIINCTHAALLPPQIEEHIFRNRKQFHSISTQIVLIVMCLMNAFVTIPGSTHYNSSVCRHFESGELGGGWIVVNILTAVALSRLSSRTKKSSYSYLLALTISDILTQIFIIFVGIILQTAILHRRVPSTLTHMVNVLEFSSNHASIWVTVILTVDRYVALCYPLQYRSFSYPERTRRVIVFVFLSSFVTGVPFYWWSDVWRDPRTPGLLDLTLKWVHCFIIYFIPCTIFLITNSVIIYRLRKRTKSKKCQVRNGKTTAILLGITTVFAVLWAPRTIVIIIHMYVSSVNKDWKAHLAMDIGNMLALLNTAVNFFLYCFVNQRFRDTVREIVGIFRWCHTREEQSTHVEIVLTS